MTLQASVLIGDLNANAQWDKDDPPERNFSAFARRLDELGLVSAYHTFQGEKPGQETRPTFYLYRHSDRPYHIDYCFIPKVWIPRLRDVWVGDHTTWSRWSDHVPMVVEIDGVG